MQEFEHKRQKAERTGTLLGAALAVLVPAAGLLLCSFTGIKYLYPPPPESTFVLDFTEVEEIPEEDPKVGPEAKSENVDKEKPVELVQRSESPQKTLSQNNATPATKPDDHGDVPVQEPERKEEPKLDARATFPGMAKKDTSVTAPHSSNDPKASYKEGQPSGNTTEGTTAGMPNAHVEGRSIERASLQKPSYGGQASGQVVVDIWVDQYGNVVKAAPGAEGTTITNTEVWAAVRNVALKAHFNQDANAPALQKGTITYIFKLK